MRFVCAKRTQTSSLIHFTSAYGAPKKKIGPVPLFALITRWRAGRRNHRCISGAAARGARWVEDGHFSSSLLADSSHLGMIDWRLSLPETRYSLRVTKDGHEKNLISFQ